MQPDADAIGARLATLDALAGVLREALADEGDCAAIVASQGHYDEPALEAMLAAGATYVGLVASRKRGDDIRAWLRESHAPNLDRLRNPAGLDLGGRVPEEVALSILGEIVQLSTGARTRPHQAGRMLQMATSVATAAPPLAVAVDPVCHMEVTVEGAAHVAEVDGVTYYFCCPGCRARFTKDPQRYLAAS